MKIERIPQVEATDQPMETYLATLENRKVRTVIIKNPVTGEIDGGFVLRDVAEVLSYDRASLKRIYIRSNWLRKYLVGGVTPSTDGKNYEVDVIAGKEGLVGGFMKLQTSRIKDEAKREKIDFIQEQLVMILVSVLKSERIKLHCKNQRDKASDYLQKKARLEVLKALSGAQIREMRRLYGRYTAERVLNLMLFIDEEDLKITGGFES